MNKYESMRETALEYSTLLVSKLIWFIAPDDSI
jgi:hypothetical protein